MAKRPKAGDDDRGPKVPESIRQQYDAIRALVEPFCRDRLDEEYLAVCRELLASLARKRPSPLASGKASGWAVGVVRAVGYVNFIADKSQTPHMKTADIDRAFGVSTGTAYAKEKAIRDLFRIRRFDPKWTLPSRMGDNPLAYLVSLNGLMIDARYAPPEVQREAVARGLIPPLPGTEPADDDDPLPASAAPPSPPHAGPPRLYTLEVFLTAGPMTDAFLRANRKVVRAIQIRGDQTLADLHEAIYAAFDRHDEHLWEFQVGTGPRDPDARRWRPSHAVALAYDFGDADVEDASAITIDGLGLRLGQAFDYWFDFGDDWRHELSVEAIRDEVPDGPFPKVVGRVGDSPPQYPFQEEWV